MLKTSLNVLLLKNYLGQIIYTLVFLYTMQQLSLKTLSPFVRRIHQQQSIQILTNLPEFTYLYNRKLYYSNKTFKNISSFNKY